jgi:hypothetical protein
MCGVEQERAASPNTSTSACELDRPARRRYRSNTPSRDHPDLQRQREHRPSPARSAPRRTRPSRQVYALPQVGGHDRAARGERIPAWALPEGELQLLDVGGYPVGGTHHLTRGRPTITVGPDPVDPTRHGRRTHVPDRHARAVGLFGHDRPDPYNMLAVYTNTGRTGPDAAPCRRVRAAGTHPPRCGHRPVAVPPVMTPRLVGRVRRNARTVAPPDPDDTATLRPPGRRQRRSHPPALSGGPRSTSYPGPCTVGGAVSCLWLRSCPLVCRDGFPFGFAVGLPLLETAQPGPRSARGPPPG